VSPAAWSQQAASASLPVEWDASQQASAPAASDESSLADQGDLSQVKAALSQVDRDGLPQADLDGSWQADLDALLAGQAGPDESSPVDRDVSSQAVPDVSSPVDPDELPAFPADPGALSQAGPGVSSPVDPDVSPAFPADPDELPADWDALSPELLAGPDDSPDPQAAPLPAQTSVVPVCCRRSVASKQHLLDDPCSHSPSFAGSAPPAAETAVAAARVRDAAGATPPARAVSDDKSTRRDRRCSWSGCC